MSLNKKVGIIVTSITFIVVLVGAYYLTKLQESSTDRPTHEIAEPSNAIKDRYEKSVMLEMSSDSEVNGELDLILANNNVGYFEDGIVGLLHHMTHQKIVAEDDQKWRSVQMTPERVAKIKTLIERKKGEFKNYDELLAIVERWLANDFSQIVDDHNFLWDLEGGTVGKAIGVMTPDQEQAFILGKFGGI